MTDTTPRGITPGHSHAHFSTKRFVLTPLAAAVVVALSPAGPALGQDDEAARIDEILVTGTKREMNLQDIAQSIDVLSAIELSRMGAKDIQDTLRAIPSVNLTALQPGQNSLTMRGISSGAYNYYTEAQAAVYMDEQPMTFSSQQVGVRNADMNRIEMLPGPQGTLFGSSSQTGTLRYITNKPQMNAFGGNVEGRWGSTEGGEDSYSLTAVLNIPLVDDKLAARFVGYTSHDGGYVDNVFGTSFSGNYDNADLVEDDFNEYDVDGGRLHIQWDINDDWTALLTLSGEDTTADGVWDSDAALGDYKVTRFEDEIRTDDWYSTSFTITGDLGFADLSFSGAFFDRDIVYEYDNMTYNQAKDRYFGGGLWYELYNAGDPAYMDANFIGLYNTNYYRSIIFNDQTQERDTFELRLVSKGDTRFQWMLGGYYEDIVDKWFYGARIPGLENTTAWAYAQAYAYYYGAPNYYNNYDPALTNPNQAYPMPASDIGYSEELDRHVTQTAVFGEIGYDLTDDWNVHAGIRWAEFDRDIFSRFFFPGALLPFNDRCGNEIQYYCNPAYFPDQRINGDGTFLDIGKDTDTIYKLGVRYNIDDDRMVYALFSQGFRVGGANSPRAARTGQVPQDYGSDLLNNYEIGLKSQWLDGRLTLNASAFYMDWEDYQDTLFGLGQWWVRGNANVGDAESIGVEIQLDWQITDRLRFTANLFSADPEFTNTVCTDTVDDVSEACVLDANGDFALDMDGDVITPPVVLEGMALPNSPKTTAHASLEYTIPNVLGGDLWFYYDWSYSSEIWNNIDNIRENDTRGLAPSWTYSSLSAGLQLPNQLDIEINVRNLFDQQGYSYIWTGESSDAELFDDPRYRQIRAQDRPRTVWVTLRKGFGDT
jgi:outer membrane receptor protein involved in Fe transport